MHQVREKTRMEQRCEGNHANASGITDSNTDSNTNLKTNPNTTENYLHAMGYAV
jgi:hypothetical protein